MAMVYMFMVCLLPIGSMYGIYGNIYHEYTPNVSIYTIHGSYGLVLYLHILHSGIHSVVVIGGDW